MYLHTLNSVHGYRMMCSERVDVGAVKSQKMHHASLQAAYEDYHKVSRRIDY